MRKIGLIILLLSISWSVLAQNRVKIDSLLALLPQQKGIERVRMLNSLALLHNSQPLAKEGLQYATEAIDLAKKLANSYEEAFAYNHLGDLYYKAYPEDWRKALPYYEKALRLREALADSDPDNIDYWRLVGISSSDMGYLYWLRGFYADALIHYDRSVALLTELVQKAPDDTELADMLARRYNSVGAIYWAQGKYSQALGYYLKSHDILVKLNIHFRQTITLSNIGLVYKSWNKPDIAITYFRKALFLSDSIQYLYGKGYAQNNIAQILEDQQEFDSANYFYNQSLESYIVAGEKGGVGMNFNGLGSVAEKQNDYKKSREYFQKAYHASKSALNLFWECISAQNLGRIFLKNNQLDSALYYAETSLKISLENKFQDQLKNNYQTLSDVYAAKRNFEKSLDYYRLFSATKDSIFSKEKYKLLAETMEKYQTEKKEEENQLLRKERERQRWQNYSLASGLVAVVLFSFFIWSNRQKIQSKNKQLNRLNKAIRQQAQILEKAHLMIRQKNEDITTSISVASRIQSAMLPKPSEIEIHLPHFFVIFKPRDVVSGDFYWFDAIETGRKNEKPYFYLATVDCTGHGVPGAFMALTGEALLRQVIKIQGVQEVHQILRAMNESVNGMFRQEEAFGQASMDMAIVRIDLNQKKLDFAAAKRPMVLFQNENMEIIKGDRVSIGTMVENNAETFLFTKQSFDLLENTSFYLFSDGFQDQFGGEKNKKLGLKNLTAWLAQIQELPFPDQKETLERRFEEWRGQEKQIDDVMLVGVRI